MGIFLIGIAVGSLVSGPLYETFGRNIIYLTAMILVMLFSMAKALAPNYGAALAFRFLNALFAATLMTVAGGTVGDIWTPMQIPFGLPFITFCAYGVSLSITFVIFAAMMPDVLIGLLMIPYIYHPTKKAAAKASASGQPLAPEVSLYWAMAGASLFLPISLFWMGWTCYVGNSEAGAGVSNLLLAWISGHTADSKHSRISTYGPPSWPRASSATPWSASS